MKITKKWLKENNACIEGYNWFCKQEETDSIKIINKLMEEDQFEWANWLLVRLLTDDQKIKYAIHAAKLVLHIFEKEYPDDNRPRKAIEAAEKCLKDKNADAADVAAYAAAAADVAAYAAAAADVAAAVAEIKSQIINYGFYLIEEKKNDK